jgi:biotin transport system permease protein
MFAPFHSGSSALHRLTPATKLVVLAVAGTGLFFIDSSALMLVLAGLALALFPLARLPLRSALAQLRPVAVMGGLIIAAQWWVNDLGSAVLVGARLVALLLLAGLVTLTTRTSAMIETLERGLRPLAALGVNPRTTALALSLSLRFIPLMAQIVSEVREAQRVRGLEHNLLALALPTLIRAVKLTDDLADALEARGFDSEEHSA